MSTQWRISRRSDNREWSGAKWREDARIGGNLLYVDGRFFDHIIDHHHHADPLDHGRRRRRRRRSTISDIVRHPDIDGVDNPATLLYLYRPTEPCGCGADCRIRMNSTTLLLAGEPNTEPSSSYLATVEPSTFHQPPPFALPFELVLDRYTREPWSTGKIFPRGDGSGDGPQHKLVSTVWQCCYLVSTDGKKRLSGFLQYLQERKKAAVAKFETVDDSRLPSNSVLRQGNLGSTMMFLVEPTPVGCRMQQAMV